MMIYKLYFKKDGKKRLLGDRLTREEVWSRITLFCEDKNYKIPYTRLWNEGRNIWYDVGSHTEFFIAEEIIE